MISKKLLSEVLGCFEVENITLNNKEINYIEAIFEPSGQYDRLWFEKSINIHELAHKCKEWAKDKNYQIHSWEVIKSGGFAELTYRFDNDDFISPEFIADTEPEAIFKACQYILDNKDN